MGNSRQVIVIYHEHVDAEWARCNDRPHKYGNYLIRSYQDVFDKIADEYFILSADGFTFVEGETYFWRNYIYRHPDAAYRFKAAVDNGLLEVVRQGDMVIDTNYVAAEGIVRNLLSSEEFYSKNELSDHWAAKMAFPWDAFGCSANMPQVYKLCGVELVGGEKYRIVPDDYWVGIDGTKLPCVDQRLSNVNRLNDPILYVCARHSQCKECSGSGCSKCDFRGFTDGGEITAEAVEKTLRCAAGYNEEKKYVIIGGEEAIPNKNIAEVIQKLNYEYSDRVFFKFGRLEDFWNDNKTWYESRAKLYTEPTCDLNPVNAGCYTTRIRLKQRTRDITYKLIRAEANYARECWYQKSPAEIPSEFHLAWQNLNLCMHHDSIGGTVIDGGYDELMDYLDEAESIAYQYGAIPERHVAKRVGNGHICKGITIKKMGDMEVTFDIRGIISIYRNGKDLFGEYKFEKQSYNWSNSEQVRIGELALMDDWGSAYSWYRLSEPLLLGKYNYSVIEKEDCLWWRGRRDVGDPSARILEWDIVVRLSDDDKRLNFVTDVNWDTANRRLKVLIPVNDRESRESVWEIPFGYIKRFYDSKEIHDEFPASQVNDCFASPSNMQRIKKLSECSENDFRPNACAEYDLNGLKITGEYPTLHWVKHDLSTGGTVAVLNKGLPSARWIPGCFELSLLRSPQMHTTLTVLPHVDDVWDIDGCRDTGRHRFEYSIWPSVNGLHCSELVAIGYEYNEATPNLPFKLSGNAVATAFKLAEDGNGFILRLQESAGVESEITLEFDKPMRIEVTNLIEKQNNAFEEFLNTNILFVHLKY